MPRPLLAFTLALLATPACVEAATPSAADYPSLHAALLANPGRVVELPDGDYEIHETLLLNTDHAGLVGPGRILMTDPNRPILRIDHARGVRLRDLTLTRPQNRQDASAEALRADDCQDLTIDGLRVLDNHARDPAIHLHECRGVQVRDCLIRNYQTVSIDDRTANPDLGYAFRCLDGTGLLVHSCQSALIQGNRIVEDRLLPTTELKAQYQLGRYTKKNAQRGVLAGAHDWDTDHTDNWMQGSAIQVGNPESSNGVQILGNTIENAAQGLDIHGDHVLIAHNLINNSLIGMKAMHGARHIQILGNQFRKNTLWSIGLMPGAASHPTEPARDGHPARPSNGDGGTIIANNIISEFGQGHSRWVWGDEANGNPLRFDHGQMPDDPPLTDVLIQGNLIYDTHQDAILIDGQPQTPPPAYRFAVRIESGPTAPKGLHFTNNLFHPGRDGIANTELPP